MNNIDFRSLFESAPGSYLVLLPDLTIVAVSDTYLNATMTKREEILGRGLFDVFPDNPDDPTATGVSNLRTSLNYVLQHRAAHTMAVQKHDIRRPDGNFEERFWSPLNKPILNEQNEVLYIIHRVEDVTGFVRMQNEKARQQTITEDLRARVGEMEIEIFKRAQEIQEANNTLLETNRFLNLILENIPNMIFVKDAHELRFVRFNKAGEELLGYKREHLIGKNDYDFFPKDEADFFTAKDREVLAGNSVLDFPEEPIQTKQNGLRILHTKKISLKNDQGESKYLLGISEDITERKRAEEALKDSEQRLALALDSGQMGAWELDLIHDTAVRSLKHDQIFGYEALLPQWGAEIFMKHVVPDDRAQVQEEFQKAFANGKLYFECRIKRPDKSIRWIAAQGRAYRNEEGTPVRMLGIVSDITERKEAETALHHLNVQLEAANKELDSFSYAVSHDLRAPLRSIDGFSQALLQDYDEKLDAQGKDFLRRVRAASQRMAMLIDDLLKLSRITRAEMRRERLDLSAIACEIADELQKTEPERRVEFLIADGLIDHGDPQLLRAAMENLLANSWKYTGRNPASRIEFGLTHHDGKPVYFVRDNGVGFDMAYAHKLFGAFQRLHSVAEFEGTGVGLATVQRIISRHGGRIWAEGKINEGATFYFSL